MGVVINIRGINASGKSTAVREYCRENGLKPVTISFRGYKYRAMTDGKRYVLGWYKPYSNSEGLDSLDADKEEFKLFMHWFLRKYSPEVVVYEKQIWSTTYKLTSEIVKICKKYGYEFAVVLMQIKYEDALNRMYERNGGKDKNFENFNNRFHAVYRSTNSLSELDISYFRVDVMKIEIDRMKTILEQAVTLAEKGVKRGFVPYPE